MKGGTTPPVSTSEERVQSLDVLRGLALLGVALVNATTLFRGSIVVVLDRFHTDPDAPSRALDWILGLLVESKAFAIFSLLFGAGMAIFRARHGPWRLARRLAVLLGVGLVHLCFVWDGDILTAYALVGLLVLPLRGPWLALPIALGYCLVTLPDPLPHGAVATAWGEAARAAYTGAGAQAFRWLELRRVILPILLPMLPRIAGLFLLGGWAWDAGLFRGERRGLLRTVAAGGLLVGGAATGVEAWAATIGRELPPVVAAFANVPLALGYVASLLLLLERPAAGRALAIFAPIGRMAFTCYLMQSFAFVAVFYLGGRFGRASTAEATAVALAVYLAELVASHAWLRRYHLGPLEWAWRALTHGTLPPMRR